MLSTLPADYTKSERPEKNAKVTNEVLKRAENAIFAKAINAIRPIEIKKISLDRAKLYAGDRPSPDGNDGRSRQGTIITSGNGGDDVEEVAVSTADIALPPITKPRLSVKERLGCKVC